MPLEPLTPEEATWQAAVLGLYAMVCLCAVFSTCVTAYGKWLTFVVVALITVNVVAAAPTVMGTFNAEALRNLRAAMASGDQQSIRTAILWAQAAGVSIEEAASSDELRTVLRDKLRVAVEAGDKRSASAVVRCVRAAETCNEGNVHLSLGPAGPSAAAPAPVPEGAAAPCSRQATPPRLCSGSGAPRLPELEGPSPDARAAMPCCIHGPVHTDPDPLDLEISSNWIAL